MTSTGARAHQTTVPHSFSIAKGNILRKLQAFIDKSPKGSIDEPALSAVNFINCLAEYVTLSSCSGRIAVYTHGGDVPPRDGGEAHAELNDGDEGEEVGASSTKGAGRWQYVNHGPAGVTAEELQGCLDTAWPGSSSVLKVEPFILHVQAASVDAARRLLNVCMRAGFRESGIGIGVGGGRGADDSKIVVAVRSTSPILEVPLRHCGATIVSPEYVAALAAIANERFAEIGARRARFEATLREAAAVGSGWPKQLTAVEERRAAQQAAAAASAAAGTGAGSGAAAASVGVTCGGCCAPFPSRNAMFKHFVPGGEGRPVCPASLTAAGAAAAAAPSASGAGSSRAASEPTTAAAAATAAAASPAAALSSLLVCSKCGLPFASRNKLFSHVRVEHPRSQTQSAELPAATKASTASAAAAAAANANVTAADRAAAVAAEAAASRLLRMVAARKVAEAAAEAALALGMAGPSPSAAATAAAAVPAAVPSSSTGLQVSMSPWRVHSAEQSPPAAAVSQRGAAAKGPAPPAASPSAAAGGASLSSPACLARYGHTAVNLHVGGGQHAIVVFGGTAGSGTHGRTADATVLDGASGLPLAAAPLDAAAPAPCPRTRHAAVAFPRLPSESDPSAVAAPESMLVVGGHNGPTKPLMDVWWLTLRRGGDGDIGAASVASAAAAASAISSSPAAAPPPQAAAASVSLRWKQATAYDGIHCGEQPRNADALMRGSRCLAPAARWGHSLAVARAGAYLGRMCEGEEPLHTSLPVALMFGGRNNDRSFGDLWVLTVHPIPAAALLQDGCESPPLPALEWLPLDGACTGAAPGARYYHSSAVIGQQADASLTDSTHGSVAGVSSASASASGSGSGSHGHTGGGSGGYGGGYLVVHGGYSSPFLLGEHGAASQAAAAGAVASSASDGDAVAAASAVASHRGIRLQMRGDVHLLCLRTLAWSAARVAPGPGHQLPPRVSHALLPLARPAAAAHGTTTAAAAGAEASGAGAVDFPVLIFGGQSSAPEFDHPAVLWLQVPSALASDGAAAAGIEVHARYQQLEDTMELPASAAAASAATPLTPASAVAASAASPSALPPAAVSPADADVLVGKPDPRYLPWCLRGAVVPLTPASQPAGTADRTAASASATTAATASVARTRLLSVGGGGVVFAFGSHFSPSYTTDVTIACGSAASAPSLGSSSAGVAAVAGGEKAASATGASTHSALTAPPVPPATCSFPRTDGSPATSSLTALAVPLQACEAVRAAARHLRLFDLRFVAAPAVGEDAARMAALARSHGPSTASSAASAPRMMLIPLVERAAEQLLARLDGKAESGVAHDDAAAWETLIAPLRSGSATLVAASCLKRFKGAGDGSGGAGDPRGGDAAMAQLHDELRACLRSTGADEATVARLVPPPPPASASAFASASASASAAGATAAKGPSETPPAGTTALVWGVGGAPRRVEWFADLLLLPAGSMTDAAWLVVTAASTAAAVSHAAGASDAAAGSHQEQQQQQEQQEQAQRLWGIFTRVLRASRIARASEIGPTSAVRESRLQLLSAPPLRTGRAGASASSGGSGSASAAAGAGEPASNGVADHDDLSLDDAALLASCAGPGTRSDAAADALVASAAAPSAAAAAAAATACAVACGAGAALGSSTGSCAGEPPHRVAEAASWLARVPHGRGGWLRVRENGLTYTLDAARLMFSSGNVSEKARFARLGQAKDAARAAAPASAGAASALSIAVAGTAVTKPSPSPIGLADETIVDLFAGIGYWTLPLLVHARAGFVHAADWNPRAIACLRMNLVANGVHPSRYRVWPGDNRSLLAQPALLGCADRIVLGLIPSSEPFWPLALRLLKPTGGVLHVHENVAEAGMAAWCARLETRLAELAVEAGLTAAAEAPAVGAATAPPPAADTAGAVISAGSQAGGTDSSPAALPPRPRSRSRWTFAVAHLERVKSYAPHVWHVVADVTATPV